MLVFVLEFFFFLVTSCRSLFYCLGKLLTTTVLNHADINALAISSLVLCGFPRVLLRKMLILSIMYYPTAGKEPSITITVFYHKKELGCILKFLNEFYFSKMWKSSCKITEMLL